MTQIRTQTLDDMTAYYADPFGGEGYLVADNGNRREWVWIDEETGSWKRCVVQRVDPLLEQNRQSYNESEGKRWGDGKVVASIPDSIFWSEDWQKARSNRDEPWLRKQLNDPDLRHLRTWKGRL